MRAVGFGSSPDSWESRPVPAFLVRHPSAGNILIDTGLHPSVVRGIPATSSADSPPGTTRSRRARTSSPNCASEDWLPRTSRFVVLTHLHEDHASGIEAFPDARFVFSATEWEGATTRLISAVPRLQPLPLRLRLRVPHGRLRRRLDRVIRAIRAQLRPLRRRLRAPRLHARAQPRPYLGDPASAASRLRDRRRRRLRLEAVRGQGRADPDRRTSTTGAARCASYRPIGAPTRTRSWSRATTRSSGRSSSRATRSSWRDPFHGRGEVAGRPSRSRRSTSRLPFSSRSTYIARTRSKIWLATRCCSSRPDPPLPGTSSARRTGSSPSGSGSLRQPRTCCRAVDRDRHHRDAGLAARSCRCRASARPGRRCATARPPRTSASCRRDRGSRWR